MTQSALAPGLVRKQAAKAGQAFPNSYPIVILTSGGLDSATLIGYYINKLKFSPADITSLYVDYGQDWHENEVEASQFTCDFWGTEFNLIKSPLTPLQHVDVSTRVVSYIPMRNPHLLTAAANFAISKGITNVASALRYGIYPDTTQEFVDRMNFMLRSAIYEDMEIETPFVWWGTHKIYNLAKKYRIPTEHTRSCQRDPGNPCGVCQKCTDRFKAFGHF